VCARRGAEIVELRHVVERSDVPQEQIADLEELSAAGPNAARECERRDEERAREPAEQRSPLARERYAQRVRAQDHGREQRSSEPRSEKLAAEGARRGEEQRIRAES
jgi:hypothetical protein